MELGEGVQPGVKREAWARLEYACLAQVNICRCMLLMDGTVRDKSQLNLFVSLCFRGKSQGKMARRQVQKSQRNKIQPDAKKSTPKVQPDGQKSTRKHKRNIVIAVVLSEKIGGRKVSAM